MGVDWTRVIAVEVVGRRVGIYFEDKTGLADRLDMGWNRQRGVQVFGQDRVAIYHKWERL